MCCRMCVRLACACSCVWFHHAVISGLACYRVARCVKAQWEASKCNKRTHIHTCTNCSSLQYPARGHQEDGPLG